jgi:hypothetical protein
MPTMQCPGCGKAVRFEGVAGVCPNCASVLRAPRGGSAATERGATPAPTDGPRRPASLSNIRSVATDTEVFAPPTQADPGGGGGLGTLLRGLDTRVLYGIIAGVVLLVGFGLYEVLHQPTATIATVTAPPPPPPTPADTPVADVPPPPPPPPPTMPNQPAVALPAWYGLHPAVPVLPPDKINDEMVERSIRKGVGFLKPQLAGAGGSVLGGGPGEELGATCLVTYALLHAGEAIEDSDLGKSSALMSGALQRLSGPAVSHLTATYTFSLRAQAMALAGRDVDRPQLTQDQAWLVKAETNGGYGYDVPESPEHATWDHSNSQYGVLGIWAASEAGLPAPAKYWQDVERLWVGTQTADGGWGYDSSSSSGSPSMTAAGVTTLCVAAEQDVIIKPGPEARASGARHETPPAPAPARGPAVRLPGGGVANPFPPVTADQVTASIDRGLAFLGHGNTVVEPNGDEGYTLYGIERAALATGFRFFGEHDWYRELGARQLAEQNKEGGSWGGTWGSDVDTAFRLLFLARGRQPLLMNKLRFKGDWNDRPRDVAKLVAFASAQLERPFAWGVADLDRDWWTWLDAPMILMSTDAPPTLSDADVAKLRAYTDAGGFLFLHNEFASKDVNEFAADLARRMFPEYPLAKVAPDDLLYHTLFSLKAEKGRPPPPPLMAVSNGARPLMVYSPTDLTRSWVAWRTRDGRNGVDLQVGLNLFVAAAGKTDFRNRLSTPYIDPSPVSPLGTVPVQRLTYAGGRSNPEPGAWVRFPRWFIDHTSLSIDVVPTDVASVTLKDGPIAVLTGNQAVDFSKVDLGPLSRFVHDGGTVLIDADGGTPLAADGRPNGFAKSVRDQLLPTAFGGPVVDALPASHPILAGVGACMTPLPAPRLRQYAAEQLGMGHGPAVQYLTYGSGTVIVSDLDLTTALLHSATYGVMGYRPDYADALYKNAILWTLTRFQPPPPPPTTGPSTQPTPARAVTPAG